jgi:hypothetical protein
MYIELKCIGVISMEKMIQRSDWLFLLLCVMLGIFAEEIFFRGFRIGISYLLFVIVFYSVFYWRYRDFSFSHQRLGWLILTCIWLLAFGYFTHNTTLFYGLNILVIPVLVMFHLLLITSSNHLKWNRLSFVMYGFSKIIEAIQFNWRFAASFGLNAKKGMKPSKFIVIKKVMIGLILSVPVLAIVLTLLMSADSKVKRLVEGFPDWSHLLSAETIFRILFIIFTTIVFFGILQVLRVKQIIIIEKDTKKVPFQIDGIIVLTFLVVLNLVYLLFTFVQFKYFFGGTLQGDFTYAEYARKGFFELLFISVINLSILTVVLTFVKQNKDTLNRLTQIMMTVLVLASAVILCSAFIRLGMYEDAYGYTFIRILALSFMIFLAIVFAYTFMQVWINRLSLSHFMLITTLVYYTILNTIDLNQIVVNKNIDRFEASGKIDIEYMNSLSYTGVSGLIILYDKDPNIPNLESMLKKRQEQFHEDSNPWQSFNLKEQQVKGKLHQLNLK